MDAVLQFKDYYVLESIYKSNPFSMIEENPSQSPKITFELKAKDDNITDAIVVLGIELGDMHLNQFNFYIKAKIAGRFEIVVHEINEEDVIEFYKVNAVAILFPYLRSLISDLTSKGSEPPIILPTMNIAAMIAEDKKKFEA